MDLHADVTSSYSDPKSPRNLQGWRVGWRGTYPAIRMVWDRHYSGKRSKTAELWARNNPEEGRSPNILCMIDYALKKNVTSKYILFGRMQHLPGATIQTTCRRLNTCTFVRSVPLCDAGQVMLPLSAPSSPAPPRKHRDASSHAPPRCNSQPGLGGEGGVRVAKRRRILFSCGRTRVSLR